MYLGTQPATGQNRKLDSIAASFDGVLTTFNLTVNAQSVIPSNVYQLFISLGGVLQNPGVDYTVNGNQITFTTAPASGLLFFGLFQGDSITGTPTIPDASITTLKLATGLTITNTAGTAGAPSVTFAGDTNTGIYSPGADQVAISTGGTGRLFVDSSGRVGIGTSSPSGLLHVSAANNGYIYSSTTVNSVNGFGGCFSGTGYDLGTISNHPTSIYTNNIERLRIDSSGRVGIGTTAPQRQLDIYDATAPTFALHNATSGTGSTDGFLMFTLGSDVTLQNYENGYMAFGTNNTERARIDSTGFVSLAGGIAAGSSNAVGIRKGSTGQLILLADSGGLYQQVSATYYLVTTAGGSTSDITLKENVAPIENALEKLQNINGVTFSFIEQPLCDADKGPQIGVIAQEVEAEFPEIVVTGDDGIKSVRYDRLVSPLIQAVKELSAKIETLEARLTAAGIE